MRAAFAVSGFTRLYAGVITSMFGDSIMLLVLSMWVKSLTGSNAMAGLTFLFVVAPSMVAPLLGVLVDRLPSRAVLVWGNAASAAGVMPLVLVRDASDVWLVWLVASGYGVSFVVLPAALNGLVKDLVPDQLLVDANASLQTTKEAFRLVGPLIGAALFAWTGGWAVAVVDAGTFAAAAAVIATVPTVGTTPESEQAHPLRQLTTGLSFVVHERVLANVLVGFALMMIVLGFLESSMYAMLDDLHRPVAVLSWLVTAQGVGAIAAGSFTSRVVGRLGEVGSLVLGMLMLAASVLAMTTFDSIWPMLPLMAVMGAGLPVIMVATNTMVQRRTPRPLMGRVSTAVEMVASTPQAVSLALGSALVTVLNWRSMYVLVAASTTFGVVYIGVRLRRHILADLRQPSAAGVSVSEAPEA